MLADMDLAIATNALEISIHIKESEWDISY